MVGVQRSKACNSCLRRKKGCDKQKPVCGQCRKACIPCQGYDRPRTFINNFVQGDCEKTNAAAQRSLCLSEQSLVRSANETKILELFWQSYFPNGQNVPAEVASTTLGGWMHSIQHIYTTENALRKAILAISLSTIGSRDESSSWMTEAGYKLYGSALQDMAVMLRQPQKRQENGALATVRLFSLFEAVYGKDMKDGLTQARSWLAHSSGDLALLKERGPKAFTSGYAHRLFVDGRLHLIMAALRDRKKSFLGDEAWKAFPWVNSTKSPKDLLLDILADVPALFETIDIIAHCEEPAYKSKCQRHLLEGYLEIEQSLTEWNRTFSQILIPLGEETIIPGVVTARILGTSHISTLYWATCIIVYAMVGNVLIAKEEDLKGRYIDPTVFCRKTLKTIPIFLLPETGIFRVHLVTFPLSVAMLYLSSIPANTMIEERALIAGCLHDPACSTIRKLLSSMQV